MKDNKKTEVILAVLILAVCTTLLIVMCALGVAQNKNTGKIETQLAEQTEAITSLTTGNGEEHTYKIDGDTYILGSYPQTKVKDAFGDTLTSLAPDISKWNSYGYYIDGKPSDFMKYYDMVFDSEKYRGVYFSRYPACYTDRADDDDYFEYVEGEYEPGKVYWFKYEPIEWEVLTEDDDTATLYTKMVIDTQAYNTTRETILGYQASDYEYCSLRTWLNTVFYNVAFSEENRLDIVPTFYDCSTADTVSLLSLLELLNTDYGFSSNRYESDSKRAHEITDYAVSQHPYSGDYYWLRSQYCEERTGWFARLMMTDGALLFNHDPVTATCYGVVAVVTVRK